MKIAIVCEKSSDEPRVAATPETVGKIIKLGGTVCVEKGAGSLSRIPDAAFKDAGASIGANTASTIKNADVVFCVRRPAASTLKGVKSGALIIGAMDPTGNEKDIAALAKADVVAVAMEFMPRISRAQSMDILSSQANLAGYQSVIDGAEQFDQALPMMMTAAGTVHPAKVFVMGAGVAGLQAVATARRLGAVVTATDVRPAAKEQVESLGAKFIAVEDEEFKQAETAGGYAKQMSAEYQKKQAELTASHIAKQDIVITTALIPGRPAPRLISREMVEAMAPGSVIVDLAAERGGNCEMTKPGQVATYKDVKIVGFTNVPGRIAASASQLFARNLFNFMQTLFDQETKELKVDWEDELVKATVLTRNGEIVHPGIDIKNIAKPAAKPAVTKATAKKPAAKKPAAKTSTAKKPAAKTAATKKPAAKKAAAKPTIAPQTSGDK
ncbi:NAD(P) transhydrogenase alpha subunit [hydrothermal vent metagenome]|uniref:proton-translocating NAD(P)(+) transhydrogenase n=1 Tax=hydrothermal vent metagenome TaxID=652676 RepID=A0A3B0TLJ4_9ZZZZ